MPDPQLASRIGFGIATLLRSGPPAPRTRAPQYFEEPARPHLAFQWDFLARYDNINHLEYVHETISRGRFEAPPRARLRRLARPALRRARRPSTTARTPNYDNALYEDNYVSRGGVRRPVLPVHGRPAPGRSRRGAFALPVAASEMLWDKYDIQTPGAAVTYVHQLGADVEPDLHRRRHLQRPALPGRVHPRRRPGALEHGRREPLRRPGVGRLLEHGHAQRRVAVLPAEPRRRSRPTEADLPLEVPAPRQPREAPVPGRRPSGDGQPRLHPQLRRRGQRAPTRTRPAVTVGTVGTPAHAGAPSSSTSTSGATPSSARTTPTTGGGTPGPRVTGSAFPTRSCRIVYVQPAVVVQQPARLRLLDQPGHGRPGEDVLTWSAARQPYRIGPSMSKNVIACVEDLFFRSKIEATARHLNAPLRFVGAKELAEGLRRRRRGGGPARARVRRRHARGGARPAARPAPRRTLPVIGFLSHVDKELARTAEAAGVSRIMPRSEFSETLPDLLMDLLAPGTKREVQEEPELPGRMNAANSLDARNRIRNPEGRDPKVGTSFPGTPFRSGFQDFGSRIRAHNRAVRSPARALSSWFVRILTQPPTALPASRRKRARRG